MTLTRSIWTPLLALDRLNSWLRAPEPSWCAARSALKPVIYWTKTQAILDLSKRWHISMRRVMVRKPCRRCDGTGQWIHAFSWDELSHGDRDEQRANYGEPCRGCEATGTATLKFIETQIGPVRWHTPSEKWWSSSLDVYVPFPSFHHEARAHTAYQYYELAEGWSPEQPVRPMPLADVQRDILIVLEEWPHEVCFAIDYHHHVGVERQWRCPNVSLAKQWLLNLTSLSAVRTTFHSDEYA